MRIVGNKIFGLQIAPTTPEEAWQRGRVLDAMLPNPVSVCRGVMRLTHARANAQDDGRMLQIARRLNTPLDFLRSSAELDPAWFEVNAAEPDNIRVSDDLLIDLLFAANGQTFDSLQPHISRQGFDRQSRPVAA